MSLGTASEHNASSKPPANRIAGFTSPTGVAESPCFPWRGRSKYETQLLFGTHPVTKLQYVCMCMSIYSPTAVILKKKKLLIHAFLPFSAARSCNGFCMSLYQERM